MKRYYKLFNLRAIFFSFSALLLLASCSSYQYAGYDNDGIYSSDQDEAYTANDYEESYDNALYYQQLFAEKADQFGNVPEEGAIFTDIEAYSSGAYDEDYMQEDLDYTVGRAAWGSDPDEISINLYNDSFYYPYYRPYYAGFYDPFWGPNYYYGFGYYPYNYGYYGSWRFSIGWGWNSWRYRYSPYYGYHHYPYYSGHYYHPYYNSYRNVAYNRGRRDSYANYNRSNRTNLDARTSRVRSYSNPRNVRAARSNYDRRTYQTRSSRVRSTSTPSRRSNSTYNRGRSSNSRAVRTQSTRSRSNNTSTRTRTSRSSSGNNNAVRSSSSSRSSNSTSRSSRGRGN